MIYCELGDMHTKIKQMKEKGKNFTESQILDWITQTALAIYYLHNQKILHRDLKSQNLFLKKDERIKEDRIKLGDFGIAKVLDTTQDLARTCIGTPYYMAPEVFRYHPYSYKRYPPFDSAISGLWGLSSMKCATSASPSRPNITTL
jgi:serine/threonine protein kinase